MFSIYIEKKIIPFTFSSAFQNSTVPYDKKNYIVFKPKYVFEQDYLQLSPVNISIDIANVTITKEICQIAQSALLLH